jgi:hypothetical protein
MFGRFAENEFSWRSVLMRAKSLIVAVWFLANIPVYAQSTHDVETSKVVVNDQHARDLLLGMHRMSLQWISWDVFGTVNVTDSNGQMLIKGEQKGVDSPDDYLRIDGVIRQVDAKSFSFVGVISTRVSHINNGAPCERSGSMTFRIIGARKYWRLKEMENPCDRVTDYVDVYLR